MSAGTRKGPACRPVLAGPVLRIPPRQDAGSGMFPAGRRLFVPRKPGFVVWEPKK